jgi:hypothetical protein
MAQSGLGEARASPAKSTIGMTSENRFGRLRNVPCSCSRSALSVTSTGQARRSRLSTSTRPGLAPPVASSSASFSLSPDFPPTQQHPSPLDPPDATRFSCIAARALQWLPIAAANPLSIERKSTKRFWTSWKSTTKNEGAASHLAVTFQLD